jgi:branched-chain amino acid transport system permease protein
VLLTELLRNFGEWRLMVYSCTLILILFFLPHGLVAPMWRRLRSALQAGTSAPAPRATLPLAADGAAREAE